MRAMIVTAVALVAAVVSAMARYGTDGWF